MNFAPSSDILLDFNFYGDMYNLAKQTFANQGNAVGQDQIRVKPYMYNQLLSNNAGQQFYSQLNDSFVATGAPTNKHLVYFGNIIFSIVGAVPATGAYSFLSTLFAATGVQPNPAQGTMLDTTQTLLTYTAGITNYVYQSAQPMLFNYVSTQFSGTGTTISTAFQFVGLQFSW